MVKVSVSLNGKDFEDLECDNVEINKSLIRESSALDQECIDAINERCHVKTWFENETRSVFNSNQ